MIFFGIVAVAGIVDAGQGDDGSPGCAGVNTPGYNSAVPARREGKGICHGLEACTFPKIYAN